MRVGREVGDEGVNERQVGSAPAESHLLPISIKPRFPSPRVTLSLLGRPQIDVCLLTGASKPVPLNCLAVYEFSSPRSRFGNAFIAFVLGEEWIEGIGDGAEIQHRGSISAGTE